jgi:P-loop containing dynein motor region D4
MLTDYQINSCSTKDEIFLEDISNMLNTGEIANLWSREDREMIYRGCKSDAADYGIYENIVETFFL